MSRYYFEVHCAGEWTEGTIELGATGRPDEEAKELERLLESRLVELGYDKAVDKIDIVVSESPCEVDFDSGPLADVADDIISDGGWVDQHDEEPSAESAAV